MKISPVLGANQLQEMAISAVKLVEQPEAGSKSKSARTSSSVSNVLTASGVKVGAVAESADPTRRLRTRRLEK